MIKNSSSQILQLLKEPLKNFELAKKRFSPSSYSIDCEIKKTKNADRKFVTEKLRRDKYTIAIFSDYQKLKPSEKSLYSVYDELKQHIPIVDNQEKLIDLRELAAKNKSNILFSHGEAEFGAISDQFYLRETAAEKLFKAEKFLKATFGKNFTFKVTDTFRPISLQKEYFARMMEDVKACDNLEGKELYHKASQFIADPNLNPPHSTGGAIDLTIYDLGKKRELNMGTKIDEMLDISYIWHHKLSKEQKLNRAMLYYTMTKFDFVNFAVEWWHYSYGEQEWAFEKGKKKAIYGSL